MNSESFDTLIVGAGLAGLSTAYFLTRNGGQKVCVVEAQKEPGTAASAQNASMICQLETDALTCALMAEGARILNEEWSAGLPCAPMDHKGSVFLSDGCSGSDTLEAMAVAGTKSGVVSDLLTRDETLRLFPFLTDSPFDSALYCNGDGIVDVKGLVSALAAAVVRAGGRIITASPSTVRRTDRGFEAQTAEGVVSAAQVVNAAGAWAGKVAADCGAQGFKVVPLKRHIFVTAEAKWVDPDWPIVWDTTHGVYFRTDGKRLMTSPCDEEPADAGPVSVSANADKLTRDKLAILMPAAKELPWEISWAGLRTFSPDRRFVIGPDTLVPGFFWAACLGGHGVTACAAVGKLAAAHVRGTAVNPALVRAFSPSRFA